MSFEDSFLYHYQSLKFQDSTSDPFKSSSIKRKCLTQMYLTSIKMSSNDTSCLLLDEKLQEYASLVDKRENCEVNNYAKTASALASHSKTESSLWTSSLKDPETTINKFLKSLDCELTTSKSPYVCKSWDVEEENVHRLLDPNDGQKPNMIQVNDDSKMFNLKSDYCSITDQMLDQTKMFQQSNQSKQFQQNKKIIQQKVDQRNIIQSFQNRIFQHKDSKILNTDSSLIRTFPQSRIFNQDSKQNKLLQQNNSDQSFVFQPSNSFSCTRRGNANPNEAMNIGTNRGTHIQQNSGSFNNFKSNERNSGGQDPSAYFRTAKNELEIQNKRKYGNAENSYPDSSTDSRSNYNYGQKRSLGARRGGGVMNKFKPPIGRQDENENSGRGYQDGQSEMEVIDDRLKNIDPKMVELIRNEIMDIGTAVTWDDIAGLEFAKSTIQEVVVWPLLRPDIFTGLRRPPKGILLFGPPGTGKTLIGKCIASQSHSTFFSISASSLTSKWIGDGEKMVRALFAVARCHQPAVVFIDEIDSLLTQRSDTEHESSRRIKTEFLVQLDGAATGEEDRILVIGATNRPQELDEAARRRLVKKLYIPLPKHEARCQLIQRLMANERHCLKEDDVQEISALTEGYSGADMKSLCQEASLGPIRSLGFADIQRLCPEEVRPISVNDFKTALTTVRASVSPDDLDSYVKWDKQYGSGGVATSIV